MPQKFWGPLYLWLKTLAKHDVLLWWQTPDELVLGHINILVRRAIQDHGIGLFDALFMACIHRCFTTTCPLAWCRLAIMLILLKIERSIEFWGAADLSRRYLSGRKRVSLLPLPNSTIVNQFHASSIDSDQLALAIPPNCAQMKVIAAKGGQLITTALHMDILNQHTF